MLSTKSRLLTRFPGAKKRVSMRFSAMKPGTSGQTSGRSSNDTKHSAGCGCVAVNGRRMMSRGGLKAAASILAGTAALLAGWGVFIRFNRYAEELEPEAMEEAKREDQKLKS